MLSFFRFIRHKKSQRLSWLKSGRKAAVQPSFYIYAESISELALASKFELPIR